MIRVDVSVRIFQRNKQNQWWVRGGGRRKACRHAHADIHLFKELAHMIMKLVKSCDL